MTFAVVAKYSYEKVYIPLEFVHPHHQLRHRHHLQLYCFCLVHHLLFLLLRPLRSGDLSRLRNNPATMKTARNLLKVELIRVLKVINQASL